jgi:IrrE N-terminal-like domain
LPSRARWAFDLTHVLNAAMGENRFPVRAKELALDYSRQRYPNDPIAVVRGDALPGFDGALIKAPPGKKGWGIFYNADMASEGRINFTLAHELGHYLLHRLAYPQGIRCGDQDVVRWDSGYGQIEHQANEFSATLLMPLDDYRRAIEPRAIADLHMLSECAERYRVSLIAAVRRWLDYAERRAVLVVSRDGFILWARSSPAALRTGPYFRTTAGPIAVPESSLARQNGLIDGRKGIELGPGIWFVSDGRPSRQKRAA